MTHPVFRLIATRPQLLVDHAQAYAELLNAEIGSVAASWKRRAMLNAVALCSLGVAAVLAGVALMLWAVMPAAHIQAPWALVAGPLLPIVLALWCLAVARMNRSGRPFENIRLQVKADVAMLRSAGAA